ncbi:uncharacterized protein EAF02_009148 [Botrytis sinoallii]|uniref:uncharacterized protein n=1 Tax=Botrytis sinoallii TaxID=1463999 RepID=UPI0019013FD9|nr:uncharacterized protein EAF02_009148 [Botrytis sinoallii]KAF7872043.1 hypothetical protein EAF02_009148 [Botrytis sinoallii]
MQQREFQSPIRYQQNKTKQPTKKEKETELPIPYHTYPMAPHRALNMPHPSTQTPPPQTFEDLNN